MCALPLPCPTPMSSLLPCSQMKEEKLGPFLKRNSKIVDFLQMRSRGKYLNNRMITPHICV